jgi:hypothetical protein
MAENRDKVYRDRAPVTALEDFMEVRARLDRLFQICLS